MAEAKIAGSGFIDADDGGIDDDLHRHPAAGTDLAHALGGQDPFDLTRRVGHHTEGDPPPLQVEQRRHRGGQRVAPEVRRPHFMQRDGGRHRVVGRHTAGQGQVHRGRGPSRRARWPARPGPASPRSGPGRHPRDAGSAPNRRNTGAMAAGSGTTSTPPASKRTASISAPIGAATRSSRTASARRARPG